MAPHQSHRSMIGGLVREKQGMLWVDKYRPRNLGELSYNAEVTDMLRKLSKNHDCPHLLFYGPSGAGKKTRVLAFLRELYGPGVEKVRVESRTFTVPNSTVSTSVHVLMSAYHIEVTPSDAGTKDRIVIQQLIKEVAQSPPIVSEHGSAFKIVVINDCHLLSREAQAGLRRTMEKYVKNCRLVLVGETMSKILPPIRSRCFSIRVRAPTVAEITQVLAAIARREGFDLPSSFATKVAVESNRDPRRALLMLETARMQSYPFKDTQPLTIPPWEEAIKKIAEKVIKEQNPKALGEVRNSVYDVLAIGIPGDIILKSLTDYLAVMLPSGLLPILLEAASHFDATMRQGTKEIFHIEAFLARLMSAQREWIMQGGK